MYLAIDTSTENTGLALTNGKCLVAEDVWRCMRNHSVELLPHIVSLLARAKTDINDITGLIAARGPGGFNGLRVGLGTAKGLALGLNVPIVGISTLEAAAYQHVAAGLPICAILPAGRTEVAWAIYQTIGLEWCNILPETISAPSEMFRYVKEPTIFAGELSDSLWQEAHTQLGALIATPQPLSICRARALAELGSQRLEAGTGDDVATLQPMYLRRPPITQPKPKPSKFNRNNCGDDQLDKSNSHQNQNVNQSSQE